MIPFFLLPFWLLFALPEAPAQEPYRRMLDNPLEFHGPELMSGLPSEVEQIRIGLFAPAGPTHAVGQAIIRGASLALEEANAQGGYQGTPFVLVQRWADDPWGAGSKEVIRLVYEDRVWAVIGSIDGESTHVAQQIVTKAFLPLLSPVSSDPSLTHIRIPWIFRLPPDDRAQAAALLKQGVGERGLKRVGLIFASNHDGRMAAAEWESVMAARGVPPVFHLPVSPASEDFFEAVRHTRSFSPDGLAVYLPRKGLLALLQALREEGMNVTVLIPWIPGLERSELEAAYPAGTLIQATPFPLHKVCGPYWKFTRNYIHCFGERPPDPAAYAYDAARMVIEGIRREGLNRSGLWEAITRLAPYPGITGSIIWDNGGGNTAAPDVEILQAGSMPSIPAEPSRESP
ncbi:MAG: ABC transporter substrate-binding protein [bacterium]